LYQILVEIDEFFVVLLFHWKWPIFANFWLFFGLFCRNFTKCWFFNI